MTSARSLASSRITASFRHQQRNTVSDSQITNDRRDIKQKNHVTEARGDHVHPTGHQSHEIGTRYVPSIEATITQNQTTPNCRYRTPNAEHARQELPVVSHREVATHRVWPANRGGRTISPPRTTFRDRTRRNSEVNRRATMEPQLDFGQSPSSRYPVIGRPRFRQRSEHV